MIDRPSAEPTVASIAKKLLEHVEEEVRIDLRFEDPAAAIETHFHPIRCLPLTSAGFSSEMCSLDGFYVAETFDEPWIVYGNQVHEDRIRFTVVHELGHHLLVSSASALLDDLDVLGASMDGPSHAEELVCHRFAGELLVPDHVLADVIGGARVTPSHVVAVHQEANASWEAVAVRVAGTMTAPGAIVLLRGGKTISFCAGSSHLGQSWWQRGATVDPDGPLARGMQLKQTALPETYRFGLPYPRAMFCDTLPVHDGLAVGVLAEKPSNKTLSVIEEASPAWRERERFCEWCSGVERDSGWCYDCGGPNCPQCDRCGCSHPVQNPTCPECFLIKPFRDGAQMCLDCESDQ